MNNLDKKIPNFSVNSSKDASCFKVSFFYCQNISLPEFKNYPVTLFGEIDLRQLDSLKSLRALGFH